MLSHLIGQKKYSFSKVWRGNPISILSVKSTFKDYGERYVEEEI